MRSQPADEPSRAEQTVISNDQSIRALRGHWNREFESTDVCPRPSVFVFSYVDTDLATDRSPIHGVLSKSASSIFSGANSELEQVRGSNPQSRRIRVTVRAERRRIHYVKRKRNFTAGNRLLGSCAVYFWLKPTFRRNVSSPSSGQVNRDESIWAGVCRCLTKTRWRKIPEDGLLQSSPWKPQILHRNCTASFF
jgi:hypothetical protein